MERAAHFEGVMRVGDRVGLSDVPTLDLYVMRRRFSVDTRESALEIVLDVMPAF